VSTKSNDSEYDRRKETESDAPDVLIFTALVTADAFAEEVHERKDNERRTRTVILTRSKLRKASGVPRKDEKMPVSLRLF
jgi:hypothetical protein